MGRSSFSHREPGKAGRGDPAGLLRRRPAPRNDNRYHDGLSSAFWLAVGKALWKKVLPLMIDDLVEFVSKQGAALARAICETEPTEQQKKAKEFLAKVYTIANNVFFIGIVLIFAWYSFIRVRDSVSLPHVVTSLFEKLSSWQLPFALAVIGVSLLILRGLLFVFKFISAVELTKLYLFIELIHLAVQAFPNSKTPPTLFLFEMLKKIFHP
jgi:hypothetical protein